MHYHTERTFDWKKLRKIDCEANSNKSHLCETKQQPNLMNKLIIYLLLSEIVENDIK